MGGLTQPKRVAKGVAAFLLLSWFTFSIQGAEPVVGSVKTALGGITVRRGAETIPVREGMHLFVNDVLRTSSDGRLGVILQDGTRVSLGPDTELRIDSFVYEPVNGRFGLVLRMARGVIAYVSGKIGQFSPASVRVETPVAVVGLRGTQFAIVLEGS